MKAEQLDSKNESMESWQNLSYRNLLLLSAFPIDHLFKLFSVSRESICYYCGRNVGKRALMLEGSSDGLAFRLVGDALNIFFIFKGSIRRMTNVQMSSFGSLALHT